jgi:putative nucleotidyltransferase with HDIG domain
MEVYVVGGYVRDILLGRAKTDIDCTVVGNSIAFAKMVAKHFHTKYVIYEHFRTALIPIGEYQLENVGTRKEEYLPNSRKPITSEGTFYDDIKRRDFTINAMAYKISQNANIDAGLKLLKSRFLNGTLSEDSNFVDIFNGIEGLKQKLLITPLDPVVTYKDDPLRMMRAARFAAQLNFDIDENSLEAIKQLADRINIISKERISAELLKIMQSEKPSVGFNILHKTGLLQYILPELEALVGIESVEDCDGKRYAHKDVYAHTMQVLDNISKYSDNVWLRFAALFHDIAKPKTKRFVEGTGWHFFGHEERGAKMIDPIFKKLKLPLDNVDYIKKLVRMHLRPMQLVDDVTDSAIRRLAVNAGADLEDLFLLCRCDITSKNATLANKYLSNYDVVAQKVLDVQEKDKLREFQSPVRGEEIMEICNIPPSRLVGIIKTNIENAILDGIIPNEYDAAKAYFISHKEEWLAANVALKQ